MQGKTFADRARKPLAAAIMLAGLMVPLSAQAEAPKPACDLPLDLLRLAHPLSRVGQKLITGEPITIVAMGSSSTWGAGASSPAANYPNQLALDLKARFPTHAFTVLNAGVGGEEIADMIKRFDTAVVAVKPDLVLWQLGTNSVIREHKISTQETTIRDGLKKIRSVGADVVLIDPQFVPRVIAKPEAERMVELISLTAKQEDVDLFRRYEVMKRWSVVGRIPFETFTAPDGLHLNDWSYACMAKGLGMVIAEAAKRPVISATAHPQLVP